jgi:RNA polymerase sigma-70 factor, ECF subfamily
MRSMTTETAEQVDLEMDADELSDSELISQVSFGNASALGQLYDRYANLLFSLCIRITRSHPDSEEVLSDVFVEVWKNSSRYELHRGTVRSYLVMLTRSRAIDRLRSIASRNAKHRDDFDASLQFHGAACDQKTPESLVIAVEDAGFVRDAIDDLSDRQKQLLEAAFFHGLSHREIAEKFSMPLGTVKTSIRRAILVLKSMLGKTTESGMNPE